jgi:uncharacterized metal-binding protein
MSMPGYRAHIGFSTGIFFLIFIYLSAHLNLSFILYLELFCSMVAGALFPDIDIKSKGQKYFYTCLFFGSIPFLIHGHFVALALAFWIALIPMMVRHRGVFHDPLYNGIAIVIALCFLHAYNPLLAKRVTLHCIFFLIGVQSHLLLDYGVWDYLKKWQRKEKKKRRS